MKRRQLVERKPLFWSRLLGLLITFAIVAVLVAGGVKNLTGELSAAYDALAASQYELGAAHNALDNARTQIAATENALARAATEVDRMGRKLEATQHQLAVAHSESRALIQERDELKRGLRDAVYVISEADRALKARTAAQMAAQAELEQIKQQPKYSVVVTTERMMQASYRERFAASQVTMFAESDAGMFFYDGQQALHEIEEHVAYAERTQVVLTTTAPGQDVLKCLEDADRRKRRGRRGCGQIVPVQASAMRMEAYSYQSQYSSMQSLLWME